MLKECAIVYDLLPNYIENLTTQVTNQFIEEHIGRCANCHQILKDMTEEIKLQEVIEKDFQLIFKNSEEILQ